MDSGGFFAFTCRERPVETVEDMNAVRIRTMTLPTHEAMVDDLGGQPMPLPLADVSPALQVDLADTQMNPIPIIATARVDEVQAFVSVTEHVMTPRIRTMNGDSCGSHGEKHRAILAWTAKVATGAGRSMSRATGAAGRGLPALAGQMQVNVVPSAALEKVATAAGRFVKGEP